MSVSSGLENFGISIDQCWRLTEALVGPSWVDVPLTLKLTPFGALDLTSILASDDGEFHLFRHTISEVTITSCDVVEIFIQKL